MTPATAALRAHVERCKICFRVYRKCSEGASLEQAVRIEAKYLALEERDRWRAIFATLDVTE